MGAVLDAWLDVAFDPDVPRARRELQAIGSGAGVTARRAGDTNRVDHGVDEGAPWT